MALSGSYDYMMKLWNISTGELIRTFQGHTRQINSVAFSPDAKTALSGSNDSTMRLWDVNTGQLIRTLSSSFPVYSVAFSANGNTALSSEYYYYRYGNSIYVKLWDIKTGENLVNFKGHGDAIWSVAFSPNGKTVLSGSQDKTLKLWNIPVLPIADFTLSPQKGLPPLTVILDGSPSKDADGSIVDYRWSANRQNLSGVRHSVTFQHAGEYPVTLTVKDNEGFTHTLEKTVSVTDTPPTCQFTISPALYGNPSFQATLDARTSSDKDGGIASYKWLVNGQSLSGRTTYYAFTAIGEYSVNLTVADSKGQTDSCEKKVVVANNKAPTAAFTVSTTSGRAPLKVTLDASRSNDADGSITTYQWTASDGQTKSGKNAEITFEKQGVYTLNLLVTDNEGQSSVYKVEKSITVGSPRYTLTVNRTGSGQISGYGISCGRDCRQDNLNAGNEITLTAAPSSDSVFDNWTGCTSVTDNVCKVTMNAAQNVTASFSLKKFALTIKKQGTGSGDVKGEGIDCGEDCIEEYDLGTHFTFSLIAEAAEDSLFLGWGGPVLASLLFVKLP